jgi:hypothetical protein
VPNIFFNAKPGDYKSADYDSAGQEIRSATPPATRASLKCGLSVLRLGLFRCRRVVLRLLVPAFPSSCS